MKKYTIATIFIFFVFNSIAQKKGYHNLFIGTNLTATGLSFKPFSNKDFSTFKDPKLGFNVGYKYVLPLYKGISVSTGIGFKNIKSKFIRQYYDPSIAGEPRGLSETIKYSRFVIPIQVYYNFVQKEKFKFYVTLGSEFIILNKADRTVNYTISSTPGNYLYLTYRGNQTIKFGENDKPLGVAFLSGIGSEFEIRERSFTVELSFCNDISKSKLLTLHNIEYDSYFFSKFKSLQLTIGSSFLFHNKKK